MKMGIRSGVTSAGSAAANQNNDCRATRSGRSEPGRPVAIQAPAATISRSTW
jgi:hypothetical protein